MGGGSGGEGVSWVCEGPRPRSNTRPKASVFRGSHAIQSLDATAIAASLPRARPSQGVQRGASAGTEGAEGRLRSGRPSAGAAIPRLPSVLMRCSAATSGCWGVWLRSQGPRPACLCF